MKEHGPLLQQSLQLGPGSADVSCYPESSMEGLLLWQGWKRESEEMHR